jgi:hypothetical protein
MPTLTFYPLGNADCCRIDLVNGKKLLFDYANMRCPDDPEDRRIDLAAALKADLDAANRTNFDVVAFTHLDADHIKGASEFFFLRHAKKYQSDERIQIDELWVPAAVITEDGCEDEAAIIQAEARHRLREGQGIRVFSRPTVFEAWLRKQGLSVADRQDLITDAGQLVPGLSVEVDGVEFFVHSPFASRQDGVIVDRNTHALATQAKFVVGEVETALILGSDLDHTALAEVVNITRYHGRDDRLAWDIFKLPHHCSYLSLGPERGKDKTEPVPEVKWLFEDRGRDRAIVVSTSKPIPENDEDDQPPHRQAANYHRETATARNGQFVVTMEHRSALDPEPLVVEIDGFKAAILKRHISVGAAIISRPAPRAG